MMANGFMSRGLDPNAARQMALGAIDRQLTVQASVIGFSKVFVLSGFILLASVPLLLFVKNTRPGVGGQVQGE
jgi:DHA2 family multidrug resistance protein